MIKIASLVFFATSLYYEFQFVFSDESCQITEISKLQIVFVVDYRLPRGFWDRVQHETAYHLIDFILAKFPKSEFSVTGFLDYPDSANSSPNQKPVQPKITDEELCYFVKQTPTSDKNKIAAAMKLALPGTEADPDASQSCLTAMLLSAVDKKINWNSGFYDSSGQVVRKIMIPMLSRDIARVLLTPGNRTTPKADGTDTCKTANIPSLEQLNEVLWENQFTVVTSVLNSDSLGVNVWQEDVYVKEFAQLQVVLYHTFFPGPKPQKWNRPDKVDFKAYAKTIYDIIAKEVMMCDWEDPIGYNSLGL